MPIYEYACNRCGKLFEELVFSAADEAGVVCPACGAGEPVRCLSACASVVAGSGGADVAAPNASAGCGPTGTAGGGFR